MKLPVILTFLRIFTIPIFVFFFYLPIWWARWIAALFFLIASLTDWLDGYVARNFSQETAFGAFLDPVADKLLIATALVLIAGESYSPYLAVPAAVIVCREISISALREWMAQIGCQVRVRVAKVAKIKTAIQMGALFLLILFPPQAHATAFWFYLGSVALYVAALLTLWSMITYLRAAWPDLVLSK